MRAQFIFLRIILATKNRRIQNFYPICWNTILLCATNKIVEHYSWNKDVKMWNENISANIFKEIRMKTCLSESFETRLPARAVQYWIISVCAFICSWRNLIPISIPFYGDTSDILRILLSYHQCAISVITLCMP